MKFLYIILSMTSLLWLASGCSHDKGEEYDPHQKEQKNKPQWVAQSNHLIVESPAWQISSTSESDNSMVATIAIDPKIAEMSDGDKVAAFCDGECLGVTQTNSTSQYGKRFFLYIHQPIGEKKDITLGYYSEKNKTVYYWVDHFTFINASKNGSTAEPLLLTSEDENNGYQFNAIVNLALPESMNINLNKDDMIALFAGEECRMCLTDRDRMSEGNSFLLNVPLKDKKEQLTIRLYSSNDNKIYTSDAYMVSSSEYTTIKDITLK